MEVNTRRERKLHGFQGKKAQRGEGSQAPSQSRNDRKEHDWLSLTVEGGRCGAALRLEQVCCSKRLGETTPRRSAPKHKQRCGAWGLHNRQTWLL